ncbi:CvpA family protein [Thermaerobacter sp. PB12/4term]|uniref:CvpA family protein n=1 Tax=Thermaerobacter sp. PB12/4term TaxID=2293838 RepID=UPI000E32B2A4|nr:CvpA family protein [Thermaerobacter sp. PB12/4term]QIA28107.1 CvpA family protein [Thermaerobacter sp. PB12/4term]
MGGSTGGPAPGAGAWALDAGLAAMILVAAWQGYRRGGLVATAGLLSFAAAAWFVATRAAAVQAWAARTGLLPRLAELLQPAAAAWLPPEVARAPVQPAYLLRVLHVLDAMPLPPGVRAEWADALREAARAAGGQTTVANLLATVLASAVIADVALYGLPLAGGLVLSAAARRLAGTVHHRGWGGWDRLLGVVAGGLEGALLLAGLLLLARQLAGLAPGWIDPAWWTGLEQSRLAAGLLALGEGVWAALGHGRLPAPGSR